MYCAQIQYRHTCTYRSQQGNPLLFAPPLVSQVEHEEEDREESRNGVEESRQLETINFRVGKRSMMEDESRNTMKFLSSAHICHTHMHVYIYVTSTFCMGYIFNGHFGLVLFLNNNSMADKD